MTKSYREFKTIVGGKELIVETGKYAEQTNGSCVIRCGETAVMVNVTMAEKPRDGMDYFPLGVDFEEKKEWGRRFGSYSRIGRKIHS